MQKKEIIRHIQDILTEIENNDMLFHPIQHYLKISEEELIHILTSEITDIDVA
jgi:energy-converting hydrogenase A subunit M